MIAGRLAVHMRDGLRGCRSSRSRSTQSPFRPIGQGIRQAGNIMLSPSLRLCSQKSSPQSETLWIKRDARGQI